MTGVLIATTTQEGLRAIGTGGQPVNHAYEQIVRSLRQRLSEEHAHLFAEPNYNPARGTVDWYAAVAGDVVALSEADPERRRDGIDALARLRDEIGREVTALQQSAQGGDRMLGKMIELALEVPDEDHIYLVGDQPVLTCWGMLREGPAPARGVLQKFIPWGPPAGARAGGAAALPMGVMVVEPLMWLAWLLWLLFGLILAVIFVVLLSGCGVRVPGFGWLADTGWANYCPVAQAADPLRSDPLLESARTRQLVLEDTLRRLELQIVMERRICARAEAAAPPATVVVPPAAADPEPAPVPDAADPPADSPDPPVDPPAEAADDAPADVPDDTADGPPDEAAPDDAPPDDAASEEIDERLDREGAQSGAVSISLAWDSDADLDLHVTCPDGDRIYYGSRRACGGELDVDMNAGGRRSAEPVENVVWADAPPSGSFTVAVDNFNSRSDGDEATPYRIRIVRDGEVEIVEGAVASGDGRVTVHEFSVP